MRLAIEPTASELAAKNATQEDIKNITTVLKNLKFAVNRSESEWAHCGLQLSIKVLWTPLIMNYL